MPVLSLAAKISFAVKSFGLSSSTPSKPKSFTSLNLSKTDKSSLIIPNLRLFFINGRLGLVVLQNACGMTAREAAVPAAYFIKVLLFCFDMVKFYWSDCKKGSRFVLQSFYIYSSK